MSNGRDETGYLVEPWSVTERGFNVANLPASESVFAHVNGHIGFPGQPRRGDPTACRAPTSTRSTSCGRCYAEAGYGYPSRARRSST